MREIGSEFWKVETSQKRSGIFPENVQWYLSGRSALQAIIKVLSWASSVSVPAWLCDSVVKPFKDAGFKVSFYPVYVDNGLIQDICGDSDVLFIMDYFGYTSGVSFSHPCIIRDVTHSLFSSKYFDANYYFGSLRKWCGVWTGGYAWTKDGRNLVMGETANNGYVSARKAAMTLKDYYINQRPDHNGKYITDKGYLEIYEDAEDQLKKVGIAPANERDIELAWNIDEELIKQRRRENAKILMDAFPEMLIFPHLKELDCPMFVPIIVPDGKRDELCRYLISKEIYCPVHWPLSQYHDIDAKSRELYGNELSLVCDQRYSGEDMNRMVKAIRLFWEER